ALRAGLPGVPCQHEPGGGNGYGGNGRDGGDGRARLMTLEHLERQKQRAAERAVAWVESGMVVGLGAGSTAAYAVRAIAALLQQGRLHDVVGVPSSSAVGAAAHRLGIPLTTLEEYGAIDLTIDGADEVDPDLNLIKGGGGALLHEKIVAQASRREVIVVDAS